LRQKKYLKIKVPKVFSITRKMIQHSRPKAKPPHEVPSTALREGVGKDLAAFPARGGGHRGRETPVPIPNTET